jgi:hypothetical protein
MRNFPKKKLVIGRLKARLLYKIFEFDGESFGAE